MSFKVGNGANVCFWRDVCCGPNSFQSDFPDLFFLAKNKYGFVSAHYEGSHLSPVWNLGLRRPLND